MVHMKRKKKHFNLTSSVELSDGKFIIYLNTYAYSVFLGFQTHETRKTKHNMHRLEVLFRIIIALSITPETICIQSNQLP